MMAVMIENECHLLVSHKSNNYYSKSCTLVLVYKKNACINTLGFTFSFHELKAIFPCLLLDGYLAYYISEDSGQ